MEPLSTGEVQKKQSCELRTFGYEFTDMKHYVEYVRGLGYKLQMMGITCEEPDFVYGDNKLVLAKTTVPASTLKKNMKSLSYHSVSEGCAREKWRMDYANTNLNFADLLTKPLNSGGEMMGVCEKIFILDLIAIKYLWGVD